MGFACLTQPTQPELIDVCKSIFFRIEMMLNMLKEKTKCSLGDCFNWAWTFYGRASEQGTVTVLFNKVLTYKNMYDFQADFRECLYL